MQCNQYFSVGLSIEYMKSVDGRRKIVNKDYTLFGLLCGVGTLFLKKNPGFVLIFQVSLSYQQGNTKAIGNAIS